MYTLFFFKKKMTYKRRLSVEHGRKHRKTDEESSSTTNTEGI